MKKLIQQTALIALALSLATACQKDEAIMVPQEIGWRSESVITLDYPTEVTAGDAFDITFSSTCGKIMIERGFTAEYDEYGAMINKMYTGLTCDTENLLWEAVGEDVFETCLGKTITENLATPGTYLYRAKLNLKAVRGSGCSDCEAFVGNKVECFMITVVEGNQNEGTFTDERDGKVYKWVKIGNQVWMAENLAYNAEGSLAYDNNEANAAKYGRLYTWEAAKTVAPEGWHLPSQAEWNELYTYLVNNGYGCEGDYNIAGALAVPGVWQFSFAPGAPGYTGCTDQKNSTGFSALPAGFYNPMTDTGGTFMSLGNWAYWWTANLNPYNDQMGYFYQLYSNGQSLSWGQYMITYGLSIRCVKDVD